MNVRLLEPPLFAQSRYPICWPNCLLNRFIGQLNGLRTIWRNVYVPLMASNLSGCRVDNKPKAHCLNRDKYAPTEQHSFVHTNRVLMYTNMSVLLAFLYLFQLHITCYIYGDLLLVVARIHERGEQHWIHVFLLSIYLSRLGVSCAWPQHVASGAIWNRLK